MSSLNRILIVNIKKQYFNAIKISIIKYWIILNKLL